MWTSEVFEAAPDCQDCPKEMHTDLSRVFKFIPNTGDHTDSTCSLRVESAGGIGMVTSIGYELEDTREVGVHLFWTILQHLARA